MHYKQIKPNIQPTVWITFNNGSYFVKVFCINSKTNKLDLYNLDSSNFESKFIDLFDILNSLLTIQQETDTFIHLQY